MIQKTELVVVPSIVEVTDRLLGERGIQLVGIDIENVLCAAGELPLFPWARTRVANMAQSVVRKHILISSAQDTGFIREVSAETGLPYIAEKENGFGNKMRPEIYQAAAGMFGIPIENMAMIDDQLKNYKGANTAGLTTYFWTESVGHIDHRGVKIMAPTEKYIIRPLVKFSQAADRLRHDEF